MILLISIWKIKKDLPEFKPVRIELPLGSKLPNITTDCQNKFFKYSGLLYGGKPLFVEFEADD